MQKLLAIIRLIRFHNCLMAGIGVWLGGYLVSPTFYLVETILASISATLVCGAGNALNDFLDIDSDRINHPERPLPRGDLPTYFAILIMIIFTIIALAISLFVSLKLTVVLVLVSLLLVIYNFKLKQLPLIGNIVISLISGATFLVGGMVAQAYALFLPPGPIVPTIFAFLFHLGRELVKDMADIEGDKKVGHRTLPMIVSKKLALFLTSSIFMVLIAFTIIPIYYSWFGVAYYIITVYFVDIPLLIATIYSWFAHDRWFKIYGSLLKCLMAVGLMAFILGN